VPHLHIDPLKIDLTAVTQTMTNAYAERYRILPVEVTRTTLTVATAEPSSATGPTSSRRS
jgi:general secretion pathway protein E